MKYVKVKLFVLATGFFAFSGVYAQDTMHKPTPDTSKSPRHDSTTMKTTKASRSIVSTIGEVNLFLTENEDNAVAKKEEANKIS